MLRSASSSRFPWLSLPLPVLILDGFAHQAVGMLRGYFHLKVASGSRRDRLGAGKVHRDILAATSDNLPASRIYAFNHYLHCLPQVPGIIDSLNLPLTVKRNLKPGSFLGLRDGIDHG